MKAPVLLILTLGVSALSMAQTTMGPIVVQGNVEAQSYNNNVVMADSFSGADWSVQTNAAISAAPTGATVDMRGFTSTQLSASASQTIAINKAITLLLPRGTMTTSCASGAGVLATTTQPYRVIGQGWYYSYASSGIGTSLISGGACPAVMDNTSQGSLWQGIDINGNSTGTNGLVFLGGSGWTFRDMHVHHFLYAAYVTPYTGLIDGRFLTNNVGGDCYLLSSAPIVSGGDSEIVNCGGNGIHQVGESIIASNVDIADSGLNGFYDDGRIPPNWTSNTQFVSPSIIKPIANNPGSYYYYIETPGCTTANSEPNPFNQTIGGLQTDGTCVELNMGTLSGIQLGVAQGVALSNPTISNSGESIYGGYTPANIRLEGAVSTKSCGYGNVITGGWINMDSGGGTQAADGIQVINCAGGVTINGVGYLGASYSNGVNPADGYGLLISNSYGVSISNWNPVYSTKSPIKIASSSGPVDINGFAPLCWSNSSTSGNDRYAIQVDNTSLSVHGSNFDLAFTCSRTQALGLLDAGAADYYFGYNMSGGVYFGSPNDSPGTATVCGGALASHQPYSCYVVGGFPFYVDDNGRFWANVLRFSGASAGNPPGLDIVSNALVQIGGSSGWKLTKNDGTTVLLQSNDTTGVVNVPVSLTVAGSNVPVETATQTVGQVVCIKAAGPPVQYGTCSALVAATGACNTCN